MPPKKVLDKTNLGLLTGPADPTPLTSIGAAQVGADGAGLVLTYGVRKWAEGQLQDVRLGMEELKQAVPGKEMREELNRIDKGFFTVYAKIKYCMLAGDRYQRALDEGAVSAEYYDTHFKKDGEDELSKKIGYLRTELDGYIAKHQRMKVRAKDWMRSWSRERPEDEAAERREFTRKFREIQTLMKLHQTILENLRKAHPDDYYNDIEYE